MDQELQLCHIALKHRHADAYERVERCRNKMVAELAVLNDIERSARDPKRKRTDAHIEAVSHRVRERAKPIIDRLCLLDEMIRELGGKAMDRLGGATAEQVLNNPELDEIRQQVARSRHGDPIMRLMAAGHLQVEHILCAREIASILRYVSHRSHAKTANYPVATQPDPDGRSKRERHEDAIDYAEYLAMLHSFVYLPWADRVRKDLPLIVGICVEGHSPFALRKVHGISWDKVVERVKEGLELYGAFKERWARTSVPEPRTPPAGPPRPPSTVVAR